MTQDLVLVDVADRVATVTLNRPEARNALSMALRVQLWSAIEQTGDDDAVDVVVLTGADPVFSAGLDLKELGGEVDPSVDLSAPGAAIVREANGLHRFFPLIDKPIIGAINGAAVTGGLEVALQCTFLVASERAAFADTHARVGVMSGGGMTVLLPRLIGTARAIEMSLTGNYVPADEALRLGLVTHVVPHDELVPFVRKLATDIVSGDQRGIRRMLATYREVANAPTLDDEHRAEALASLTWTRDTDAIAARRSSIMERGRSQVT